MTHLAAVFVDRDGVVNAKAPEGDYVKSWDEFAFLPGALDGLRSLSGLGVPVVVVTNQRGVARGRMSQDDLNDIHERMTSAVLDAGGRIDGIYACAHEGGCECRKPGTKLFTDAAADLGFDVSASVVIGDRASDMEAARRIGARAIFVSGFPEDPGPVDATVADLPEAAHRIRRYSE